jgi:CDP-4-dehydro-6-deoxyglucose reductase
MTILGFGGRSFALIAGESVLECLERHGVGLPSFCRVGVCQTCILQARQGVVPAAAQLGLKETWKAQGCFLSCVCRPKTDLDVERCGTLAAYASRVESVEHLAPDVLRVRLSVPDGFGHRAGQFVQVVRPHDGLTRPFSLASLPGEDHLELHVRALAGGQMSGFLASAVGAELLIKGPLGECYYREEDADRQLVLAATGTGVAPLLGVLRAALAAGHRGGIRLYHGSSTAAGLYLWKELRALVNAAPALSVIGSVLSSSSSEELDAVDPRCAMRAQPLDAAVFGDIPSFGAHRIYLCGDPELVRRLRRGAYLAGGFLDRIHADPFVPPGETAHEGRRPA